MAGQVIFFDDFDWGDESTHCYFFALLGSYEF